jgi:hypothetical protein
MKLEIVRMNTTFKKTLVATAILAFAGAAQAATLAGTEHTVTPQYLASTGANHTAAAYTITLGAEYTLNDTITLDYTAKLASAMSTTLIAAPDAGNNRLGVTFSKISGGEIGDTTVTYRLTATDTTGLAANPVTSGVVLTVAALNFAKADLASGVKATFSAKTNTGLNLDTAGGTARTASLVKVAAQFTAVAPSFARVIDVNADRKSFVDSDTAANNPHGPNDFKVIGTFNITEIAAAATTFTRPVAVAAAVKHTVTGDFSWVVDNDTVTAGLQPKAGVFAVTGTCATPVWTYSTTAVTLTCDAIAADTAIVIDPEANKVGVAAANVAILAPQSFTATSTVTFTGPAGSESVLNGVAAGSWTLNGSQVRVPYMVTGGGRFGVIANVTNHGSKSGAITLDVYKEDGTKIASNYPAGTSNAGSVTSVAAALNNALIAAGVNTANTTKFSFQVTTNVPENDVIVYAAYTDNTTSERAIVNNDSKTQTK